MRHLTPKEMEIAMLNIPLEAYCEMRKLIRKEEK